MATHDPPDALWWAMHLLDGPSCLLASPEISETSVQMNQTARTEFLEVLESNPICCHNSVENDEAIAYLLQEELYHLDMKEAAEGSQIIKEDVPQTSVLVEDFLDDERGIVSQHIDHDSNLNNPDDSSVHASENVEVSQDDLLTVDQEVEKRLTDINQIPHVPRINGEIPTFDDASAAHQRLLDRLKWYGLSEVKINGDGNCQFRALSDQLYRTNEYHKDIRERVVKQLKAHPDWYEGYVPMEYSNYLKKMEKNGEWGDHVTLQAAADSFGVKIRLLTSFKDTCFIEILPRECKSKRVIYLSFWAEVHYNSVYPETDLPSSFSSDTKTASWQKLFKSQW